MGKDRFIGAAILLASVLVAIAYALLLYFGYGSTLTVILVSVALYILLGIVGWIGWTIATTPSPKPIESEVGSAESTEEKRARTSRRKRKSLT